MSTVCILRLYEYEADAGAHVPDSYVAGSGTQHGYGIMTDIAQISEGRVRLRAGTLYAALDRLSTDRLLEVDREEIVDARLRRYYRLTPAGRTRLADETARLRAHAALATSRLRLAGS